MYTINISSFWLLEIALNAIFIFVGIIFAYSGIAFKNFDKIFPVLLLVLAVIVFLVIIFIDLDTFQILQIKTI